MNRKLTPGRAIAWVVTYVIGVGSAGYALGGWDLALILGLGLGGLAAVATWWTMRRYG